jgi:hypothetical protein
MLQIIVERGTTARSTPYIMHMVVVQISQSANSQQPAYPTSGLAMMPASPIRTSPNGWS